MSETCWSVLASRRQARDLAAVSVLSLSLGSHWWLCYAAWSSHSDSSRRLLASTSLWHTFRNFGPSHSAIASSSRLVLFPAQCRAPVQGLWADQERYPDWPAATWRWAASHVVGAPQESLLCASTWFRSHALVEVARNLERALSCPASQVACERRGSLPIAFSSPLGPGFRTRHPFGPSLGRVADDVRPEFWGPYLNCLCGETVILSHLHLE